MVQGIFHCGGHRLGFRSQTVIRAPRDREMLSELVFPLRFLRCERLLAWNGVGDD